MIQIAEKEDKKLNDKGFKQVTFGKWEKNNFQTDVKKAVDEYFKTNNISTTANAEMKFKTIFIIVGWLATYGLILSNILAPWVVLVMALLHGLFTAMIGLNIGHDAIHGAYFKSPEKNRLLSIMFNLVGANDYVWSISHNIVHHTYTNIPEHDEDIKQVSILRVEPTQELKKIHRYQHIYAYFLYCFSSISWVFIKDYVKFFQHRIGGHYRKTFPRKEIIRLFTYKAIYYTAFLVVPLLVVDLPWYLILAGFFAAHFVEGFTMAIIFMLAHVIEGTQFPIPDENGKVHIPWADMQMMTTSNFAIKNKLVNFMFGGLNFQVEHHLFPRVCHVHYPKLSEVVRKTAEEHNLPYLEQETFFGAIASHSRILKAFGHNKEVGVFVVN